MATFAEKSFVFVLLIATLAGLLDALKSIEGDGVVRRFARADGVDLEDRGWVGSESLRQRREAVSLTDSVQCIRISGMFEERTKEEKIAQNFANEVHLNGDNKANLQLAWTGTDYERIIVVTGEFGASSIYVSDDSGKRFNNMSHIIDKTDLLDDFTLQKHTNESKIVYMVANSMMSQTSVLYVSLDGASSFRRIPLDFRLDSSILFHETKVEWLLALDESFPKALHLSKDKGLSWEKIRSNVVAGKWGTGPFSNDIFIITNNQTTGIFVESYAGNVMEKSSDLGLTWKQLHNNIYTFGIGDKFVYASVYKDPSPSSERYLKVSTDGGITWNDVLLPTISQERFFSILDSSEGLIFLHVDHPGDTGRGTLYTSDSTGIIFSESLPNHLYPNYEDLTDFYKVQSMRAVYIASQLLEDDSIHTLISYNRGAEWQPIKRPEGVPCKDETKKCYLQIHNLYSIKRGISADPPLSVPNAAGIILVHGHIADALQTTAPDVFVSSDGGYSWRLALKGPHHYQIADHGSLLVAVPADTDTPSIVKFSTDEGRCWLSYNFTEKKIIYTGLLIEPGNRDMSVAIWGYTPEDRIWHTHILDFTTIVEKQCDLSDYEEWVPHQHNDDNGCLLGQKETFRRLKADSWCYNGKAYALNRTSEPCMCTADDFDCDYGYKRVGDICIKDTSVTLKDINICFRGHEEKFVPMGYHKIPGDKCVGGFLPAEAKLIDLSELCDGDTPPAAASATTTMRKGRSYTAITLTAMFAILSLILIIVLVTYLAKKYEFIKKRPTYRYSSIRCEEDEPTIITQNHTGTSLFDDTSDEEVHDPLKLIPNGSRPNGHHATNGHIPNGSGIKLTSASIHHMKTKLIESDVEMLE